jgi:hypothetical protein
MSHFPHPENEQFYKLKIKELHTLWRTVATQKLAEFKEEKGSSAPIANDSISPTLSDNQKAAKQILSEFVPLFKEIQAKKLSK